MLEFGDAIINWMDKTAPALLLRSLRQRRSPLSRMRLSQLRKTAKEAAKKVTVHIVSKGKTNPATKKPVKKTGKQK